MRDDFAVFILSHGRAHNQLTLYSLVKQGYSGKWYIVIDDEDDQKDEYILTYGRERVVVFNKAEWMEKTDSMDNFHIHGTVLYARNACYSIADDLNLKYFLVCDDDFTGFSYRYIEGETLKSVRPERKQLDLIFSAMLDFLIDTDADIVSFSTQSDIIGGVNSERFKKRFTRKTLSTYFCRVDKPVKFAGTSMEDVIAYTSLGSKGKLFFAYVPLQIETVPTKSYEGGNTALYIRQGDYGKHFYSVMAMPSSIREEIFPDGKARVRIVWSNTVPEIVGEEHRKGEKL